MKISMDEKAKEERKRERERHRVILGNRMKDKSTERTSIRHSI